MENNDFLVLMKRNSGFVQVPDLFYETYKDTLPKRVTIVDNIGDRIDGEIRIISSHQVFIETAVREIFQKYTYRDFAIVRFTYKSNGRFRMFVPPNTNYFHDHAPINGLLPYNYHGPDMSGKFDSVGMYKYKASVKNNRCTRYSLKKVVEQENEVLRKLDEVRDKRERKEAERLGDSSDRDSDESDDEEEELIQQLLRF